MKGIAHHTYEDPSYDYDGSVFFVSMYVLIPICTILLVLKSLANIF